MAYKIMALSVAILCAATVGAQEVNEIRGNDLYVLTPSALYVIPDGVTKRENRTPKNLIWGVPRGFAGQGFRSLAWGPEGDLYFSVGDAGPAERWRHWTFFSQPEGTKTPFNGIGAILRCKPDGSRLQVVASGLRDPGEVVFDPYWNLFTTDSVARLQVTPHAYFGWPREGVAFLPALLDSVRPPAHTAPLATRNEMTPEKLWQELGDPSWPRRYRAHVEMMRRGGDFLKQANKRLLHAKADDPALHSLIWLAAASQQGSLHLLSLLEHADPRVRAQAVRALTEFPDQLREEPLFTKLLLDDNPKVQHAAMLAYFSPKFAWDRPIQQAVERGPACSDEPLLRQTATRLLAAKATRQQLEELCGRFDAPLRLAGVLAVGYRLTLPDATKAIHAQLPLGKWSDESAYVIEYAGRKVDLRKHGRLGTYTVAAHWNADMHTVEEQLLFKLLCKMLNDGDEAVRVQAARFLAILNDPRSAAEVQRVLKN